MEGLEIISWRIVTTRIVVTLLDREYHSTLFFKIYPPARFLFPEAKKPHRRPIFLEYHWRKGRLFHPTARTKSSWNGLWTRNRRSFKWPLRAPHMLSGEFKKQVGIRWNLPNRLLEWRLIL